MRQLSSSTNHMSVFSAINGAIFFANFALNLDRFMVTNNRNRNTISSHNRCHSHRQRETAHQEIAFD